MLSSASEPLLLRIPTIGQHLAHCAAPLNSILILHRNENHTSDTSWFAVETSKDQRNICLCIYIYK